MPEKCLLAGHTYKCDVPRPCFAEPRYLIHRQEGKRYVTTEIFSNVTFPPLLLIPADFTCVACPVDCKGSCYFAGEDYVNPYLGIYPKPRRAKKAKLTHGTLYAMPEDKSYGAPFTDPADDWYEDQANASAMEWSQNDS